MDGSGSAAGIEQTQTNAKGATYKLVKDFTKKFKEQKTIVSQMNAAYLGIDYIHQENEFNDLNEKYTQTTFYDTSGGRRY